MSAKSPDFNRHDFNGSILREYDIRGIVGPALDERDAYALGRGFAAEILEAGGVSVAVGRDGRESSPLLENELVRGLADEGVTVLRIGLGPTPMLYYAAIVMNTGGGIMVTGSHNPAEYNGFKMVLGGKPFFGEQIKKLGRRLAEGRVTRSRFANSVVPVDIIEAYIGRVVGNLFHPGDSGHSVVWDCGNGAAGEVLQRLVKHLPGKHMILNGEIDGRFPAHHPDPTVAANLRQLIGAVRETGADLGIAFDGDADRIGAVDGDGNIVAGDQLVALLARDVLATAARTGSGRSNVIITDVKASRAFFDVVSEAGGTPLMWKTGHSLIKSKIAETGAPLAGEMSGHIFFADDLYGFDDALYAAVRLLDMLQRSGKTLATLRAELPSYVNTPELRFDCEDSHKFRVVREVAERLKTEGADVCAIDGVRVNTPDGWWLLRASNTQSVLVARAESSDQEGLDRLKGEICRQILASGLDVPDMSGDHVGY